MAFIVPVMKKDYALYGGKNAQKFMCASRRMTMPGSLTPARKASARLPRLSLREPPPLTPPSSSASSPLTSPGRTADARMVPLSPPSTPIDSHRRRSRRISIRRLNSDSEVALDPSCPSPCATKSAHEASKRHVHFGFCEEISYESSEDEAGGGGALAPDDNVHRADLARRRAPPVRKAHSVPARSQRADLSGARGRSRSSADLSADLPKERSLLAHMVRFVRLCSPRN